MIVLTLSRETMTRHYKVINKALITSDHFVDKNAIVVGILYFE